MKKKLLAAALVLFGAGISAHAQTANTQTELLNQQIAEMKNYLRDNPSISAEDRRAVEEALKSTEQTTRDLQNGNTFQWNSSGGNNNNANNPNANGGNYQQRPQAQPAQQQYPSGNSPRSGRATRANN